MNAIMKPSRSVGIIGYGAYVPIYRLPAREISNLWRDGQDRLFLPIKQNPNMPFVPMFKLVP